MSKSLLEKYSKSPYLRAFVSLIPNIGGALDILLSEKATKFREERLGNFLSHLDSRVKTLELKSNEIEERFSNEEFYDLFIHAVESSLKTRYETKQASYANILINQLEPSEENLNNAELMMIMLDNLSIEEIKYLSVLQNINGEINVHLIYGNKVDIDECKGFLEKNQIELRSVKDLPDESKFELFLDIIWKFLSDKNLVEIEKDDRNGSLMYSYGHSNHMTTAYLEYEGQIKYRITEFGKEFINWVVDSK
jgi:hypothetical protein